MNLQDIVMPLADLMVWTFDSLLVPFGEFLEQWNHYIVYGGMLYAFTLIWLWYQRKYDKIAAQDPDQLQ